MSTAANKRARNEPPPQPIIVKKVINEAHGGHHGGAWKIAYADFVTAMMAFFLLMWLIGATNEQQRQGLADYFTPTLVEFRQGSAGSSGIMGGDSIIARENYPTRAAQTGSRAIVTPRDATGGDTEFAQRVREEQQRFQQLREQLEERVRNDPNLRRLQGHMSFTQTDEGLRIDLVDQADFSMFEVGTNQLRPEARELVGQVGRMIAPQPNQVTIRGHTDSRPYGSGAGMSNWTLSTGRADATRGVLERAGVSTGRFERIEGVADREPFVAADRMDARNRRISISLVATAGRAAGGGGGGPPIGRPLARNPVQAPIGVAPPQPVSAPPAASAAHH